jgi:hypothetical protein
MSEPRPFRFLDLPKELRLMVYERLPVKTTYHTYDFNEPHYVVSNESTLNSFQLVWKTLSGLSILATCRQITTEATPIIEHKLRTIESEPIRMIATPDTFCSFILQHSIIDCISLSDLNCASNRDLRKVMRLEHNREEHDAHTTFRATHVPECHVDIAIKCVLDDLAKTAAQCLQRLQYHLLCIQTIIDDEVGIDIEYRRAMHIRIRLTSAWSDEDTLLDATSLADEYDPSWQPHKKHKSTIRSGSMIQTGEWEKDWAEGERYM